MSDHQSASEYVCTCGGNCGCGGARSGGQHQKQTMVAVGKCPMCASGILEAEGDQSPAACSVCGFREITQS